MSATISSVSSRRSASLACAAASPTASPEEESEFTFRATAALVKFVLVPLLLVYTTILYAYAVEIALAWDLPKARSARWSWPIS